MGRGAGAVHADETKRGVSRTWARALEATASIGRNRLRTLPVIVDELACRFGAAPALESADSCLSYRMLADLSHRYARWALARRLRRGEVVCLLMPNCPEYLAIWLGMIRIGTVVSLLNTHLRGEALAHAIQLVRPSHIIVGAGAVPALESARARLPAGVRCWVHGAADLPDLRNLADEVAGMSPEPLASSEVDAPSLADRALYVYTSGTTGLPKAACVSHFRLVQWSHWFAGLMDTRPSDRMYDCLPFYHGVGGIVAPAATLVGGGTVVVREGFRASDFWRDVVAEKCTLFQYIGELCRFLVGSPPQPDETAHAIRLCCGGGLRKEVWETFQSRFRIPRILEFYASTEGNVSLFNCEGRPGAIGRIPPFLAHRNPVALLKVDLESHAPLRGPTGLSEPVGRDEVGEAVGKILDPQVAPATRFEGYSDPEASNLKVLRNVFEAGDAWYRTGDLMRRDEAGFYYFHDRLGDSYRWKGENVSAAEVGAILLGCTGVSEALVYGVRVPGTEGRAGMAALVVAPDFDLSLFHEEVCARLPGYARPLLLRLLPAIETTGTFRPTKQALRRDGFDPARIADPLCFDDRERGAYVPLVAALFERLTRGQLRV